MLGDKKNKVTVSMLFIIVMWGTLSTTAYANSSWIWLTRRQPYELLPLAVLVTLVIETGVILFSLREKKLWKTLVLVIAANLISFLLPYLFLYLDQKSFAGGMGIREILDKGPFYIVGAFYLIITLVMEVPIVYVGLKREMKNKKRGLLTIIASNVVTTALVCVAERMICRGHW